MATTGTEEKVGMAQQALEAGIATRVDSESWKAYIRTQARFHKYSPTNTMLIYIQRPDATRVAGYTMWKKLGRQVKLGEKGIFIMAPSFSDRRKVEPDEATEEGPRFVQVTPAVKSFHVAHVFDVSQTVGDDLPAMPGPPCPEVPIDLLDMLKRLANRSGDEVHEHADPHAPNGRIGTDNIISVQRSLDSSTKAAVLAHEIAHHYLKHLVDKEKRYLAELEAESVAYMVLYAFGVNTDLYSFSYIAAWQQHRERHRGGPELPDPPHRHRRHLFLGQSISRPRKVPAPQGPPQLQGHRLAMPRLAHACASKGYPNITILRHSPTPFNTGRVGPRVAGAGQASCLRHLLPRGILAAQESHTKGPTFALRRIRGDWKRREAWTSTVRWSW